MDKNLFNLQTKIKVKFKNTNLFKRVITYKSYDPINNYEKFDSQRS